MQAVGAAARSSDSIRGPTRTTDDADFASRSLIQILHPDLAAGSGRSRMFPDDGPHCFEPLSNTFRETSSRETSTDQFTAAPIGDRGEFPKRHEE